MAGMDALNAWVDEVTQLTKPDRVVWLTGAEAEYQNLIDGMLADHSLTKLNQTTHPNSYLSRSAPSDVARTEEDTYICTTREEDAGPNNNWLAPDEAKRRVRPLFDGVMRGRTMYVIPYLMGPVGSPLARVGVEVTDSPYVAVNMQIMTRMGEVALDHLRTHDGAFFPGLHSVADLDPENRYILHFPEENLVWSINSGYGGNALLGKKCLSLRLASWAGRQEGWLAEHMLILGLEDPSGKVTYMAGAFPSACGKTNLAMLVSPLTERGWRVWTVGDDIAWMRVGEDGRLWAVNPEHGFFGVAPGTNAKSNPNAMAALASNTIFTNTALTPTGEPWWEDIDPTHKTPPEGTLDWQGDPWERGDGEKPAVAAHPNSRFTTPAGQCPSISPSWEDPQGVPISAFIFGGRRARVAPLVYQSFNWRHGVFVGASMASEQTAAVDGAEIGKVRRDPMAMLPFCGYNMGDYFAHWLAIGEKLSRPPIVFHVNWFRKDADGEFLWPGFGQNVRVLMWMYERIHQTGKAQTTPIGYVPTPDALDLEGLTIAPATLDELLRVNTADWEQEVADLQPFFAQYGEHLPAAIAQERAALQVRLSGAPVAP